MVGGEDCLSEASSAAAPDAALRPKKISGSGVAFSFPYFFWLSKRNRVANRARATISTRHNPTYVPVNIKDDCEYMCYFCGLPCTSSKDCNLNFHQSKVSLGNLEVNLYYIMPA